MKKNIKIYYTFDQEEKKQFKKMLVDLNLTMSEVAEKLGVSTALLYAIIDGRRSLTSSIKNALTELGFKFNCEE